MDTQNTLSQYPAYAAIFVIALIVIVVLSSVVVLQNRKISEMNRPKFGFLGKSLSMIAIFAIGFGGIGLAFYTNKQSSGITESFADIKDVTVSITYFQISGSDYKFNVLPSVNNKAWGADASFKFDIYWTFKMPTSTVTQFESGINSNNQGGVVQKLQQGKNLVKASVFVQNKKFEKEIEVVL
jgi:hypothetical protein